MLVVVAVAFCIFRLVLLIESLCGKKGFWHTHILCWIMYPTNRFFPCCFRRFCAQYQKERCLSVVWCNGKFLSVFLLISIVWKCINLKFSLLIIKIKPKQFTHCSMNQTGLWSVHNNVDNNMRFGNFWANNNNNTCRGIFYFVCDGFFWGEKVCTFSAPLLAGIHIESSVESWGTRTYFRFSSFYIHITNYFIFANIILRFRGPKFTRKRIQQQLSNEPKSGSIKRKISSKHTRKKLIKLYFFWLVP
jgi:hypothetical protein